MPRSNGGVSIQQASSYILLSRDEIPMLVSALTEIAGKEVISQAKRLGVKPGDLYETTSE